jgi:hypothetical protein
MRASAVFGRVLHLYRGNLRFLLTLAVLVFVPVGVAKAVPVEIHLDEVGVVEGIARLGWLGAELAVTFYGVVFYSGAISGLVEAEAAGRSEVLSEVLRRLPYRRLAAIDFLVTVGTLVGLALLVIPGLVFLAYHALATPLAEMEGLGVRSAMRRSRELVRGRLWTVIKVVAPILIASIALEAVAVAGSSELLGEGIPADWLATTATLIAASPFYALAAVVWR